LPKGGGALKGIDEKFEVNSSNGTASFSIPLPLTQGRSGFTPSLSLSYNSGGGNSIFGLGWSLGIPSIQRKTDKKLPRYRDNTDEDTFMFSGAEDLVPFLIEDEINGGLKQKKETTADGYIVKRYRPRIEGGFARIEKIYHSLHGTYWKVTTRDNVATIFGRSENARIADPKDKSKVFQWMPEFSYDDKGNWMQYNYKKDSNINTDGTLNTDSVIPNHLYEKNRKSGLAAFTNSYLKSVTYGYKNAYYALSSRPYDPQLPDDDTHFFELVIDYGEHDPLSPTPEEVNPWNYREDAFSSYRSGFEIRTNRLCQRVLMFHHFPDEKQKDGSDFGVNYLVRSMELEYEPSSINNSGEVEVRYLGSIVQNGHIRKADGTYATKSLPPLEFTYQHLEWNNEVKTVSSENIMNAPVGLTNNYQWTDLYGEGISGILTEQGGGWYYKENWGKSEENSDAEFTPAKLVAPRPSFSGLSNGSLVLQDLDADGRKQLVVNQFNMKGYFELSEDGEWDDFITISSKVNININDPFTRLIDLNGDGKPELVVSEENAFLWYPSLGKDGYEAPERSFHSKDEEVGPAIVFADTEQTIFLADMSGDGLTDIVRIRNGEICYWTNLGYGKFGAKINMSNTPHFDYPDLFNPQYLHLADVSGTGATDIIYLGKNRFQAFINHGGNSWSDAHEIEPSFPYSSNAKLSVVDLLGTGTSCIVWSSDEPQHSASPMRYIDLMSSKKPHVMVRQLNNMGKETTVQYKSSTYFYLKDKREGNPWITKLSFPVQVVATTTVKDHISSSELSTSYLYHHGYYDHEEREFRGFGMVEQIDDELFESYKETYPLDMPSILTKTWIHTGSYTQQGKFSKQYEEYYYSDDKIIAGILPDSVIEGASEMSYQELCEATRALKGKILRQEVTTLDGSVKEIIPYTITDTNYTVKQIQAQEENKYCVYQSTARETLTYNCERITADPRITHKIVLEEDEYGHTTKSAQIAYPRRNVTAEAFEEQRELIVIIQTAEFENEVDAYYRLGLPVEQKQFEIRGNEIGDALFTKETLIENLGDSLEEANILLHHESFGSGVQAKLLAWNINHYKGGELKALALPDYNDSIIMNADWATTAYDGKIDALMMEEAGYEKREDHWWLVSEKLSYLDAEKFYLPHQIEDAFGNISSIEYDDYHLATISATDALLNTVVAEIDYRNLSVQKMTDINDTVSETITDELGMVIATTIYGTEEGAVKGDSPIADYEIMDSPNLEDIVNNPLDYLQEATSFFYYHLEPWETGNQPPHFVQVLRETHVSELETGEETMVQISLGYSDGFGREFQSKVKADDGKIDCDPDYDGERWLTSGRTIYNNKEKPVKQYEPDYRESYLYESEEEFEVCGVSPIMYYDALGRLIKTETPDGFFSKVAFDPWQVATYDQNDTVLDSDNYAENAHLIGTEDPKGIALEKALPHYNTPTTVVLDSLGREFIAIQLKEEEGDPLITFTEFDIQGNPLTITDPRQVKLNVERIDAGESEIHNFIYSYDLAGNVLKTISRDAGTTYNLINVVGNPVHSWNARDFYTVITYDELHRPTLMEVTGDGLDIVAQKIIYGTDASKNQNGQLIVSYDPAGKVENTSFDFKGQLLETTKQLCSDYKTEPNWKNISTVAMEADTYKTNMQYDALGRVIKAIQPDGSIHTPQYHHIGWLKAVSVQLREDTFGVASTALANIFVEHIEYDAKGQRTNMVYGNGVRTIYDYDYETFRLKSLRTYRREADGSDTDLQDIYYVYDPVGNIVQITDNSQELVFNDGSKIEPVHEYRYDALYQLEEAIGREHNALNKTDYQKNWEDFKGIQKVDINDSTRLSEYTRKYLYDDASNLLEIKHTGNNSFTRENIISPTSNRAVTDGMGVTEANVDDNYDDAGNLTELDHIRNIEWNYRNNISSVAIIERDSENDAEYYVYDGAGQRTRKIKETYNSNGDLLWTEEKIYLRGVELKRKFHGTGKTLIEDRSTNHIMDDQKRIAIAYYWTLSDSTDFTIDENKIHYQLGNHLGSASLELDIVGQIISYEEFFPYGGTSFTTGKSSIEVKLKEYRYTGKEIDNTTALYYYGARYYLPWLGRWLSSDPAGLVDGMNLYSYARNSPVSRSDSNGRDSDWIWPSASDVWQGIKNIPMAVTEPLSIVEDLIFMGLVTAVGEEVDIEAMTPYMSGTSQRLIRSEQQGDSLLNKGRAALLPAASIITGGLAAVVDNTVQVFEQDMSPEEASSVLTQGAATQVGLTGLAVGLCEVTGNRLTGRAPKASPEQLQAATEAIVNQRTAMESAAVVGKTGKAARQAVNETGDATLGKALDQKGPVVESIKDGGPTGHVEMQLSSKLMVQDQATCPTCQASFRSSELTNSVRTYRLQDPAKPARSSKTASQKAARGKGTVVAVEDFVMHMKPPLGAAPLAESQKSEALMSIDPIQSTQVEIEAQQCLLEPYW
jgi:RHS repeat-associated protein